MCVGAHAGLDQFGVRPSCESAAYFSFSSFSFLLVCPGKMETAWSGPFSILLTISSFYSSLTRCCCCCCCCKGCFLFPCYSARADQSGRKSHITPSLRRPFFFLFLPSDFLNWPLLLRLRPARSGFCIPLDCAPKLTYKSMERNSPKLFLFKKKKRVKQFLPGSRHFE